MAATGYLDSFLEQLLTARKSHYSEDSINFYLQEDKYIVEDLPHVKNPWQERLKCTLVQHRERPREGCRCILYLHGMGSTRLEALSVVQCMPVNYCLCMFDLSGSGKSQGDLITYGIKECEDIEPVITHLHTKFGLRQFVLWGRSMGAVAALLYVLQTHSQAPARPNKSEYLRQDPTVSFFCRKKEDAIKAIVLDSPFHNFRDVVKEKAIHNFSVPTFLAETAAGYIQSSFSRILSNKIGERYNPFLINFSKQINLTIPIIMVYSEKDEVVPASHSQRLIKSIKSKFEKILINDCNHNEPRPAAVLTSIFEKIDKYNRVKLYESRRFSSDKSNALSYSCEKKRGIFVFTPSKQKQFKTSTELIQTERRFIQPANINLQSPYESSMRQSPKSAVLTPRRTKISLQSSQMLVKNAKEEEKQSHIATIDTQTNSLINKKLVGVPEGEGKSKILRSMRFNMDRRRQVKLGRQRYLQ